MATEKVCVLDETRLCDDCGECLYCDLDPNKLCDNCMQCIMGDADYNGIRITGIVGLTEGAEQDSEDGV